MTDSEAADSAAPAAAATIDAPTAAAATGVPTAAAITDATKAAATDAPAAAAGADARFGWRSLLVTGAAVALLYGGGAWWRRADDERAASAIAAVARPGDIAMLSSLTCAYCTQARRWFTAHRVPFSECFIESDVACAARYRATGAAGTPTLLVRGQRQLGFSSAAVAQALGPAASRL